MKNPLPIVLKRRKRTIESATKKISRPRKTMLTIPPTKRRLT